MGSSSGAPIPGRARYPERPGTPRCVATVTAQGAVGGRGGTGTNNVSPTSTELGPMVLYPKASHVEDFPGRHWWRSPVVGRFRRKQEGGDGAL